MKQKKHSLNFNIFFQWHFNLFQGIARSYSFIKNCNQGKSVQHIMDTSFAYFGSLQVNIMELCVQWTIADGVTFFSAFN